MRRIIKGFCGLLLMLLVLQGTGCGLSDEENGNANGEEKNTVSSQDEVEIENDDFLYGRSESILLDVEMDFAALGIEYYDDAVELYQDEALDNKIYCQYDWDKEQKTLSLSPPKYSLLNVSTIYASKSLLREFEHSDYYLFEKEENKDWGNLGKMYLVKWLDLQTGKKLTEPEITEITVKGELDTPKNFRFEVSEYGTGIFSWESVENAERYLIVSAACLTEEDTISGFNQDCDIIAETTDTSWQSETEPGDIMNQEFRTLYDMENREYYYGVIAVGKEGTSMISNLILKSDMAKRLPYCKEAPEGENLSSKIVKSIDLLSRYQWIRLCDGTMAQHLIRYSIDEAEPVNITCLEESPREMLAIPYLIEGTEFEGTFYVEEFDRDTYPEALEELWERQNVLKSKMTGMLSDIEVMVKSETAKESNTEGGFNGKNDAEQEEGSHEDTEGDFGQAGEKQDGKTVISGKDFAENPDGTTELSRYLASCLLKGMESITVEELEKRPDEEALTDAFYEAYFQNPLIPAVKQLTISQSGEVVSVSYEESAIERERKQRELIEEVKFVAGELVEEGMSDVDKVLAVNSYLCDNVAYDVGAAEQTKAGERAFTDSMTPYGALINHRGVCLGYAGAFKLLAQEMGLESIVVTGTLNGNQNHAWNKVKIDGKWCVVDVTSNDGQDMKNVFLNVSDEVAGLMLKEDNRYLCDESIGQYSADTDEFEYYHLAGRYYETDMIAEALEKELSLGNKAVLRTEITLTDEEFQTIVNEVMDNMDQVAMQGYYQLGVIYLERKEDTRN